MGDDKKKSSGGSKGGALKKLLLLVILLGVGAEIASRMLSQPTWSPMYWVQSLLLKR